MVKESWADVKQPPNTVQSVDLAVASPLVTFGFDADHDVVRLIVEAYQAAADDGGGVALGGQLPVTGVAGQGELGVAERAPDRSADIDAAPIGGEGARAGKGHGADG